MKGFGGIKGKMQKKVQGILIEQAYLSYKYGWHQAQVNQEAKLSKKDFCGRIKQVIEEGKKIADGIDFPRHLSQDP